MFHTGFYVRGLIHQMTDNLIRLEAMNVMLQFVKQEIDERFHPDGYNIGINVNEAAGQSVFHVHMHLIPRYKGDVPNPKGGVKGCYPWQTEL